MDRSGVHILQLLTESLRQRGVVRTAQVCLSHAVDRWFDFRQGVDTCQSVGLNALSIESANRARGFAYISTRARDFKVLLAHLGPAVTRGVFVDFGCGKGKTLMLAAEAPFARVVGIDFSAELTSIARSNLDIYARTHRLLAEVEILTADVVDYRFRDDETLFYFFHPFEPAILREVVGNIDRSYQRRPRSMQVVYQEPAHREVLDSAGHFAVAQDLLVGGARFLVYARQPAP